MDQHTHEERAPGASLLNAMPKSDPFVVEPGLFDRFPHQVQALAVEQGRTPARWSTLRRLTIALPMIALAAGALWWWQHDQPAPPPTFAVVDVTPLTDDEIDAWAENDLLAAADEALPPGADDDAFGEVDMRLDEHELVAYLEYENTDINELIIEE